VTDCKNGRCGKIKNLMLLASFVGTKLGLSHSGKNID
jgi:hypothetical protein